MKKLWKHILSIGSIACLGAACTKPFTPATITSPNSYLVVEGNINTGTDSTTIQLSRTVNISSAVSSTVVPDAAVSIQDNQNGSYTLTNLGNGAYTSGLLTLDPSKTYRINITTADGKNYVSDYVTATVSPPIDSIGYTVKSNGLQIYVNTHDPNNNTHYYRWDYIETWEFRAEYESEYISNGTELVSRSAAQNIYKCWTNDLSNNIQLASTAKLSQDVVFQNPLTFIPSTSEKIEARYSILLKQYAMTTAAYNYYTLLKQNTEELGSIFDAQPSTLTGNIHCTTNTGLPVIGYITAGTIQRKRVYIDKSQIPQIWRATYPYNCEADTALFSDPHSAPPGQNTVAQFLVPLNSAYVPVTAISKMGPVVGYLFTDHECADCSIRGATTAPAFWIPGPYD